MSILKIVMNGVDCARLKKGVGFDGLPTPCYIPSENFQMNLKAMRRKIHPFLILVLLFMNFSSSSGQIPPDSSEKGLENFFKKEKVRIAVTDSGLGGLSIVADISERMKEAKIFTDIHLVFFNALFSSRGGYNSLKTREEKIRVFNSALQSIETKFQPDLILIGCNTLSTLYNDTPYARRTALPVIGILEVGVELIARSLQAVPESQVILFGTQTTISEATHKKRLIQEGFEPERILLQACPELVDYIERGYDSDETEMLISAYVHEALSKFKSTHVPLHVSLNCTHYGYSLDLWKKAFSQAGVQPLSFIDPNTKMVDLLFRGRSRNRFESTNIAIEVVSMIEINRERQDSIGRWLERISPQTAEALRKYRRMEDLFEWKKYLRENSRESG